MQIEETKAETAIDDMPCHSETESQESTFNDTLSDCDCPDCIQHSGLTGQLLPVTSMLSAAPFFNRVAFNTVEPDGIFYPPKSLS